MACVDGWPMAEYFKEYQPRLRAGVQIHGQIPVHDTEATGKLEAGIAVMAPDTELLFN
ncbi:hypothetical protein AB6724_05590 [Comamonas guangdongensis]|uniref:Uncharacterized protein n=1 Tax=Comamonas guangdongensis TaxID=510515 RepID=A0ABV3ZS73_9BURK